jgi:hypothetical protein
MFFFKIDCTCHGDNSHVLPTYNTPLYSIRHVVQGGPVTNHLSQGINLRKPFTDADLNSVTFQEYHADYPHKKYTLGYGKYPHNGLRQTNLYCDAQY